MTMRLPILQLSCRLFLAKQHIIQVCQPPHSPDLAPCDFWFFPKLKSPLTRRRFVNATVTQYTSSVNGVSLPTAQSHGRVAVHGCTVRSPLTGCQVTSRPRDRFSRYSKWHDTFWIAIVQHCAISSVTVLSEDHRLHIWGNVTQAMASSLLRFLNHTQRRITVGRTSLDERSARRRDHYLTTHNTQHKHPCPRRDSNPQSQQASGRRPTPQTARPLRSANISSYLMINTMRLLRNIKRLMPFRDINVIKWKKLIKKLTTQRDLKQSH